MGEEHRLFALRRGQAVAALERGRRGRIWPGQDGEGSRSGRKGPGQSRGPRKGTRLCSPLFQVYFPWLVFRAPPRGSENTPWRVSVLLGHSLQPWPPVTPLLGPLCRTIARGPTSPPHQHSVCIDTSPVGTDRFLKSLAGHVFLLQIRS